jgi:hypothetical protein
MRPKSDLSSYLKFFDSTSADVKFSILALDEGALCLFFTRTIYEEIICPFIYSRDVRN